MSLPPLFPHTPTLPHPPLHGRCTCGRNRYLITPPSSSPATGSPTSTSTEPPQPFRLLPPSHLRVPLTWFHSTTHAFFPDETHAAIRRVYTPPHDPARKQYFCGFCGTPISYWTEEEDEVIVVQDNSEERERESADRGGKEWVFIPLRSLGGSGVEELLDRGLLGTEGDEDDHEGQALSQWLHKHGRQVAGTMDRGRISRWAGGKGESGDGSVRVEWEVIEWTDAGDAGHEEAQPAAAGKRKMDDMEGAAQEENVKPETREADVPMRDQ